MDTEINQQSIYAHIAGLIEINKIEFYKLFNKSHLNKYIEIVDVDLITTKIIEDINMDKLFKKYSYYFDRSKENSLSKIEIKNSLNKSKEFEKKMFQYWKVKMEYYINKLSSNVSKKIILIGYLSFFNNHKIYLNLNIVPKFFLKVDYNEHSKNVIKYNLENYKNDIIEGNYDLNYLNSSYLIKVRIQLQNIYIKINYIIMSMMSIINTLELLSQTEIPNVLYYASFIKYNKKIPILNNPIQVYTQEWLALSSILLTLNNMNKLEDINLNIEKGINKDGNNYINILKQQFNLLNKNGYLYEIVLTDNFLPYPTKNNIYKFFSVKPIKINRILEIDNIINQIKKLNIYINII
jgi:hypothetical protein